MDVDSVNMNEVDHAVWTLSTSGSYAWAVNTYHHGNLRPALTAAAVELGREKGPEGIVLREVARRTGVSHNAAYRHFADRDDLLAEVAAEGLTRLAQSMSRRIKRVKEPDPARRALAKLREVGRAYVEFALKEPGLFSTAFSAHPTAYPGPGPFELLGLVLDECVTAGAISTAKRSGAEITCWASVHGFSLLHLNGPLRGSLKRDREEALTTLLARVEDGLTSSLKS